jgi:hypothetical protein
MSNSADGVVTVLELLQRLHEVGTDVTVAHGCVVTMLDELGIGGFDPDDEDFFLTVGLALKILLRQANTDPTAMFAAASADLIALGKAFDDDASGC